MGGSVSSQIAGSSPFRTFSSWEAGACAKVIDVYKDRDYDFGIDVEAVRQLTQLDAAGAHAVVDALSRAKNEPKLINALSLLAAIVVVAEGKGGAAKQMTTEDRAGLIFDVFDFDSQGRIGRDELTILLLCTVRAVKIIAETGSDPRDMDMEALSERAFDRFAAAPNSGIARAEFAAWVKKEMADLQSLVVLLSRFGCKPLENAEYVLGAPSDDYNAESQDRELPSLVGESKEEAGPPQPKPPPAKATEPPEEKDFGEKEQSVAAAPGTDATSSSANAEESFAEGFRRRLASGPRLVKLRSAPGSDRRCEISTETLDAAIPLDEYPAKACPGVTLGPDVKLRLISKNTVEYGSVVDFIKLCTMDEVLSDEPITTALPPEEEDPSTTTALPPEEEDPSTTTTTTPSVIMSLELARGPLVVEFGGAFWTCEVANERGDGVIPRGEYPAEVRATATLSGAALVRVKNHNDGKKVEFLTLADLANTRGLVIVGPAPPWESEVSVRLAVAPLILKLGDTTYECAIANERGDGAIPRSEYPGGKARALGGAVRARVLAPQGGSAEYLTVADLADRPYEVVGEVPPPSALSSLVARGPRLIERTPGAVAMCDVANESKTGAIPSADYPAASSATVCLGDDVGLRLVDAHGRAEYVAERDIAAATVLPPASPAFATALKRRLAVAPVAIANLVGATWRCDLANEKRTAPIDAADYPSQTEGDKILGESVALLLTHRTTGLADYRTLRELLDLCAGADLRDVA